MGQRFYEQQLQALGECPGRPKLKNKRKRKMAWDDDKKALAVKMSEVFYDRHQNAYVSALLSGNDILAITVE